MEDVGSRRVVDDDNTLELTSQTTKILHIVSAVKDASFSEKSRPEHVPFV
jgi:hypothetical protein